MTHPLLQTVRRWTSGRKLELVEAVRHGVVTLDDALRAHGITPEEFASWAEARRCRSWARAKALWFLSAVAVPEYREIRITLVDMFGATSLVSVPAHDVKAMREALLRALADIPREPTVRQFEFPRAVE